MTAIEKGVLQKKKFSIEWKIERFFADCEKAGDFYKSQEFPIEHADIITRWYLEVYPKGETAESKDFVSLYLGFVSDAIHEVVVDCELSIASKRKSLFTTDSELVTFKGPKDAWGFDEFVKQDLLKEAKYGALIGDTLTISCKITFCHVTEDVTEIAHGYNQWLDKIKTKFPEDAKLFGATTDVTFSVQEKKIHLHKAILMSRNSVFKAMFEHEMKEKKESLVEVVDVDYNVMKELFRFIYTGKVENIKKVVKDLLIAADKYSVTELKALCEKTLYRKLQINNAIKYLKLAVMCDTILLRKLVIKFVAENLKDIVPNCNFKLLFAELNQDIVSEVMQAVAENK